MHIFRLHSIKFLGLLLIVAALLGPSILKIGHGFEHEVHHLCKNSDQLHLHELDDSCNYCKIQLNLKLTHFFLELEHIEAFYLSKPIHFSTKESYPFLDNTTTRGPPSLV